MKLTVVLVSCLGGALVLVAGCKPAADKPAVQSSGTAAQQLDQAQGATTALARDLQGFAFTQKAEFVSALEARLTTLNRNLDELTARVGTSSTAVQAEAKPKLAALRNQADELKQQLAAVQGADVSTWEGVKADASKSFAAVQDGFNQSRQWVSDKIAP